MAIKLPSLRVKAMETVPLDASRTLFRVGGSAKVSDLLHALPMMKGTVVGEAPSQAGNAFNMFVDVQRASSVPTAGYYDNTANHGPTAMAAILPAKTRFPVARIGIDFPALAIDSVATTNNTAANPYQWQCYAAAFSVLRQLDNGVVQGTGAAAPVDILGLQTVCTPNRTTAATANFETDVRNIMAQITPNGSGTGEGVHCLIGGPTVLRKLMATTGGQNGQSGYRIDPRSGRFVYHYQGVPYYKAEALESGAPLRGRLYAANLGPSGLTLVHAYGDADTFGVVVDEQPITSTTGAKQLTVHGAWALVTWENESIYELTAIDITTGL